MAAKPLQKSSVQPVCALTGPAEKTVMDAGAGTVCEALFTDFREAGRELQIIPEWNKIVKHRSEEEKENIGFPEYFRIASVV